MFRLDIFGQKILRTADVFRAGITSNSLSLRFLLLVSVIHIAPSACGIYHLRLFISARRGMHPHLHTKDNRGKQPELALMTEIIISYTTQNVL